MVCTQQPQRSVLLCFGRIWALRVMAEIVCMGPACALDRG